MFNKKIKFIASDKDMESLWPHPKPANHFIPSDYKKLERLTEGDLHQPTLKACVPFLDAMTMGYIIPFDQDYIIDPVEKDFSVSPASKEREDFGFHNKGQLPQTWHKITGENAGKFHNKWLIVTPPGYSCLFVHPLNRSGTENRFELISGVVDTDSYINLINFPFILKKRDKQFLIKKGDAMVQVIPFKRESWKIWSGFYYEKRHSRTLHLLFTEFLDRYRKRFWHKKNFR